MEFCTQFITKPPAAVAYVQFQFLSWHNTILYHIYYPCVFNGRIVYVLIEKNSSFSIQSVQCARRVLGMPGPIWKSGKPEP